MNHNNPYDFISSNIIRRTIIEEHEISMIPKCFNTDAKVLKFNK